MMTHNSHNSYNPHVHLARYSSFKTIENHNRLHMVDFRLKRKGVEYNHTHILADGSNAANIDLRHMDSSSSSSSSSILEKMDAGQDIDGDGMYEPFYTAYHPTCEMIRILKESTVFITPHGFQSILSIFQVGKASLLLVPRTLRNTFLLEEYTNTATFIWSITQYVHMYIPHYPTIHLQLALEVSLYRSNAIFL